MNSNEEEKTKKKRRRKRKRNKNSNIQKEVKQEEEICQCEKDDNITQEKKEPEYNEYDFMKLDTLEDRVLFCQKLYEDIIKCSETLDHKKIRKIMDVINKYLLYENEKDETLINLELVNMLKEISNYEVKPVWQRVTSGVGIKLYVGLEYKGIVFSLCRDFE